MKGLVLMYDPHRDPLLKKLEQAAMERAEKKAETVRRHALEDEHLDLARRDDKRKQKSLIVSYLSLAVAILSLTTAILALIRSG